MIHVILIICGYMWCYILKLQFLSAHVREIKINYSKHIQLTNMM